METLQPDLFATFDKLQKAIKAGNVEKSKEFAASLAKQKVTVQVKEKEDESSGTSDDFISVKVYIEDKEGTGANTTMQLIPSMKIKDLKAKMLREHGFAPEIQRWIMGKKIVNDEETLKKNRIKSGSSIFLYLLSPQSVGISKEEYDRLYGDNTSIGGRTGMQDTVQMGDPQQRRRNPSTQSSQTSEIIPDLEDPESSIPSEPPPPPPVGVRPPSQRNRPPPPPDPPVLSYADVGWTCPQCTFRNEPTRPGCEMCASDRPEDYAVPQGVAYEMTDKEKRRLQRERDAERLAEERQRQRERDEELQRSANYDVMMATLNQGIVANEGQFDCAICFDTVDAGEGVTLRECLHQFCRDCLQGHISNSEEPQIRCPFQDDQYSCPYFITDSEIRELVTPDVYDKYLQRGLAQAESQAANSFHCKTPDCQGWCLYDDDVNFFDCIVCGKKNCLTCKAIHEGQNCKQYQDDLRIKAQNDEDAKKTQKALEDMLKQGDAMECPHCRVVITKKLGCDWLKCTMCRTEICWVTKGRRWGPNGPGDTSGGCKCNVNRVKCHPNCQNCH